jgi:hypothetical protein
MDLFKVCDEALTVVRIPRNQSVQHLDQIVSGLDKEIAKGVLRRHGTEIIVQDLHGSVGCTSMPFTLSERAKSCLCGTKKLVSRSLLSVISPLWKLPLFLRKAAWVAKMYLDV